MDQCTRQLGGYSAPPSGRILPAGIVYRPPVGEERPTSGEPDTEELRAEQLTRELQERGQAAASPLDDDTAQHERRAEKAHYLREKLAERAESERKAGEAEDGPEGAGETEPRGSGGAERESERPPG